ncbi:MAG: UDP-glucose/GDP-mannose dehydrogenase family protein [Acidimicrobiales bacterium]|nr:UDP-glucose/GDP-mannose dehydrogenase family protein [Acidimicrobiales bacterium]
MANIAVIGAGYVGLTIGASFAHLGHDVTIADIDETKVELLKTGTIPFFEIGLSQLVADNVRNGNLNFVVGASNASSAAEFYFLCLPTPQNLDGSTDMGYFNSAIDEIQKVIKPDSILVNKSTLPVGTAAKLQDQINRNDIQIVSNPEFLSEGNAIHDFLQPSRIVIGAASAETAARVAELYADIDAPILITDTASAELIKHTSNAFLAIKLTFVNEIATLCELVDADIIDVAQGIGYDPRIGSSYLKPGPGWGGSCFPKDSASLLQTAKNAGFDFGFLEKAITLNQEHLERTAQKVLDVFPSLKEFQDGTIAVWGLTFKAGTDDLRSSPSLVVIEHLLDKGASICAYDPMVHELSPQLDGITIENDPYAVVEGANALVILTEWEQFSTLNFEKIKNLMQSPTIIDARNILQRSEIESYGFDYVGMGR